MKVAIKKLKDLKTKIFGKKIDPYWIQELKVKKTHDRMNVFFPYMQNKKVLHIGCSDYPIFNPKSNLHLKLKDICSELHGMDVDAKGIEVLSGYFPGKYFEDLVSVDNDYDTILVPETIEHVDNVAIFLNQISKLKANTFIISAPNCFNNYFKHGIIKEKFVEFVHPDHNYWFSPYTLKNTIEKYSNLRVIDVYLSNNDLMVICVCSKSLGL